MTASESLGEQFKLYHGSNQEFNVGDEVKPGDMVPRSVKSRQSVDPNRYSSSRWSDDFAELGHHNFVWSSSHPENTGMYGKNLYEVKPQGLTERYTYKTGVKSEGHPRVAGTHEGGAPGQAGRAAPQQPGHRKDRMG